MTTTVAVVDAKTTTGDRNDETTNPRKRSFQEPGDDQKGESGSGDQQQEQQTTPKLSSSARRRNRKKRQKTKTSQQQAQSQSQAQSGTTTTTTTITTSVNSEKQKQKQKPLAGLVLSVSTMKDKVKAKKQKKSSDEAENDKGDDNDNGNGNDNVTPSMLSYNEVCRSCKDLGAEVIDLVCKRVSVVICTEAAVRQATQRVRKAIKRNKPLVSVEWLEECRKQNRRVEFEDYRLDKKAEGVVQNREDKLRNSSSSSSKSSGAANGDSGDDGLEGVPDSAWSEPQELGCCCVCHENGTTADCPWCVDCNV